MRHRIGPPAIRTYQDLIAGYGWFCPNCGGRARLSARKRQTARKDGQSHLRFCLQQPGTDPLCVYPNT